VLERYPIFEHGRALFGAPVPIERNHSRLLFRVPGVSHQRQRQAGREAAGFLGEVYVSRDRSASRSGRCVRRGMTPISAASNQDKAALSSAACSPRTASFHA
jgi:hypothetical protein